MAAKGWAVQNIITFGTFEPHCDLDQEERNPNVLNGTLPADNDCTSMPSLVTTALENL